MLEADLPLAEREGLGMSQVEMYRRQELPHVGYLDDVAHTIARRVEEEERELESLKERFEQLELVGQVVLVGHKLAEAKKDIEEAWRLGLSDYYPQISDTEMKLWEMWLPEIHPFDSYGDQRHHYFIPDAVLDEYEMLKKLGLFEKYWVRVCHHERGYELLFFGVDTNGTRFRIARWGERLLGEERVLFLANKVLRGQETYKNYCSPDGPCPFWCYLWIFSLPGSIVSAIVFDNIFSFHGYLSLPCGIIFLCCLLYFIVFAVLIAHYEGYRRPEKFLSGYR